MKGPICIVLALAFGGVALPALASSSNAWAALESNARKACIAKSGLKDAKIDGKMTDFKNHVVVTVRGKWKPQHMKNKSATFLCLYDKRTKKAETSELGQFP